MSDHIKEVKRRIGNDLANHQITLLHNEGLYRHWRCRKPGTSNLGFDVITWPGFFCVTGDMGEYLFSRVADMLPFMHRSCMSYEYAAEKCLAHDGKLEEFDPERLTEWLDELEKEAQAENDTESLEKINEVRDAYSQYEIESDAFKAIYESGLDSDPPRFKRYTYHFLWVLYAIKWFCDSVNVEVPS